MQGPCRGGHAGGAGPLRGPTSRCRVVLRPCRGGRAGWCMAPTGADEQVPRRAAPLPGRTCGVVQGPYGGRRAGAASCSAPSGADVRGAGWCSAPAGAGARGGAGPYGGRRAGAGSCHAPAGADVRGAGWCSGSAGPTRGVPRRGRVVRSGAWPARAEFLTVRVCRWHRGDAAPEVRGGVPPRPAAAPRGYVRSKVSRDVISQRPSRWTVSTASIAAAYTPSSCCAAAFPPAVATLLWSA